MRGKTKSNKSKQRKVKETHIVLAPLTTRVGVAAVLATFEFNKIYGPVQMFSIGDGGGE